jgi:outer membrane protein assembly factor BamB
MNVARTIRETRSFGSPAGRPQPLAVHGGALWVGCWDTARLYALDPHTGAVREEHEVPGKPFGLASYGGALRAVISLGDDDDRYFFTCVPGAGIDLESKTACPDLTGSHLAADGDTLYLGQMTNGRILALDAAGTIVREIPLPTRCAGFGFGGGASYMISTDDEFEDLTLATFTFREAQPQFEAIAALPTEARSLAFDGTSWWTNLREANRIVAFSID